MSLEHAILGFLRQRPLSGYDLKSLFDQSVRHFWTADQSQIYRTLARMTENEWVTVELIEQTERPDRKVYHITEAGREEFGRWLHRPVAVKQARSVALIQLYFAADLPDVEAKVLLKKQTEDWREVLSELEEVLDTVGVPVGSEEASEIAPASRREFFAHLTLECGLATARAQVDWLEGVTARLEAGGFPGLEPEGPGPIPPSPQAERRQWS